MATNFFERQERARGQTVRLVVVFMFAICAIVAATSLATYFLVDYFFSMEDSQAPEALRWGATLGVGLLTVLMILLGSLYKVVTLRSGGGRTVAEGLGGRLIYPNTEDLAEIRVLNVVEEMALAAGVPVPPVYLLADEKGINAFAAGYSPSDAVIGVTRGAVDAFSRDQLQGVIAHEFSHILNGDMRLGIRLIGILHGIVLLGLTGRALFHIFGRGSIASSGRSSSGKGNGGQVIIAIFALAALMVVIGAIGVFIGSLIRAAVSRQREHLADASAVQFTRNPSGLSGALKRIGARGQGSVLKNDSAAEASHLFFAAALNKSFASFFATHPPLPVRILAVEPNWDGVFPVIKAPVEQRGRFYATEAGGASFAGQQHAESAQSDTAAGQTDMAAGQAGGLPAIQLAGLVTAAAVEEAMRRVGEPSQAHQHYARNLIGSIPPQLKQVAHDPYGSRALIFALLLDRDQAIMNKQLEALGGRIEPHVIELAAKLTPHCHNLDVRLRLPLVDMAIPALQSMSPPQFEQFETCFWALVQADEQITVFEWALSRVIHRHLASRFKKLASPVTRYYGLQRLTSPISLLLSMLSHTGHEEPEARQAFALASKLVESAKPVWFPRSECKLSELEKGLKLLRTASPKLREQVVSACTVAVCADGKVRPAEAELLRGVADLLDCPVPPVLAGQTVDRLLPTNPPTVPSGP